MAYGVYSDQIADQFGNAIANASVTVYSVSGGSVVTNPLATIYTAASSITGSPVQQNNPLTTDALGRYSFGAPDGFYAVDVSGSNFPTLRTYVNLVATYLPGSGGVSNVSLALPSQFAITGSPVTGVGTLTGSWNTQTANTILAGPTSGGAVAPTFRAMVAADFPASGVTPAAYNTLNTGTGALVLTTFTVDTYGRVTTTSNTSINIPLYAVQGTWTRAQNVASVALTFGNPLVTDATLGNAFHTTVSIDNFTFNDPTGLVSGGTYIWRLQQDGAGTKRVLTFGGLFTWPGGIIPTLSTTAGAVDLLTAYYDGTKLRCSLSKAFA